MYTYSLSFARVQNIKYINCCNNAFVPVPTTTTEAPTTPRTTRTTSEGEIVPSTTTGEPTTTTPGEVCERVLGMDDPQLVPDQFIEVSTTCCRL